MIQRRSVQLAFIGLTAAALAASCSGDEPSTTNGNNRGGTAGSGMAGAAGTAVAGGGMGGTVAGGGGTAGTGGAVAGSGGATAGSGGSMAGSAGSGGAMGGSSGDAGQAGESGEGGEGGESDCQSPLPPGGGAGEGGAGGEGGGTSAEPAVVATYTFDGPGSQAGFETGFGSSGPGSGTGDTFIVRSTTEGNACAGSLQLTVPFTIYGNPETGLAQGSFSTPLDWTGYTTLHVSLKIADPGIELGYLNGVQIYVQSGGFSVYSSVFTTASTFADFDWHDIELDLTADPPVMLTAVNQVGIQLVAQTAEPSGGPAAPVTTVAYIDDIWVE